MLASRVLRAPAVTPLQFLIQPRSTWDIFKTGVKSLYDLTTVTGERDVFNDLVNKDVLRPQIFAQADMGVLRMLALYDDLKSPYFKKYDFQADEFLSGAKLALEQYHELQMELEDVVGEQEIKRMTHSKKEGDDTTVLVKEGMVNQDLLAQFIQEADKTETAASIWKKEAEKDPKSLASQLMGMVTPTYFDALEKTARFRQAMNFAMNAVIKNEPQEISNVALMSARAMKIDVSGSTDDESNKEIDDSKDETKIAAQVQVLYEISTTITERKLKPIVGMALTTDDVGKEKTSTTGSTTEEKDEATETINTMDIVMLGTFEGWLAGDPDGAESVRWRLAEVRPPTEFPLLYGVR
eukprot:scaffold17157_cov53-Attheya_sp.AAC.7